MNTQYIFKDEPVSVYSPDGLIVPLPEVTKKGRVVRLDDNWFGIEEKLSSELEWSPCGAGTAEFWGLTEQEIKWAVDKR